MDSDDYDDPEMQAFLELLDAEVSPAGPAPNSAPNSTLAVRHLQSAGSSNTTSRDSPNEGSSAALTGAWPGTPISSVSSGNKRSRSGTEGNREAKSRRISPQPGRMEGRSSDRDQGQEDDLLEFLGLSDDEDYQAVEEEQRMAEQWLAQRREQERRDEEFARSLQQTWNDIAPAASSPPILLDDAVSIPSSPPAMRPIAGPSSIPQSSRSLPMQRFQTQLQGSSTSVEQYLAKSYNTFAAQRLMKQPQITLNEKGKLKEDPIDLDDDGHSSASSYFGDFPLDPPELNINPLFPGQFPNEQMHNPNNPLYNMNRNDLAYLQNSGLSPDEMRKELTNLLENIRPDEQLNVNREGTPEAMKYPLMEHQKLGLAWMRSMEDGSNKGGILADDMGLGKTIQALALMVSNPSPNPDCKTNLVVAPVALMQQWKREINRMLKPGEHQLSVFILHGGNRFTRFETLKTYDVVLTTYGTLASELKRKKFRAYTGSQTLLGDESVFYRVILDEAQCVKNRKTISAQACYDLQSIYRWCMSGTPMMNSVAELFSLICFLRIGPYNKIETFNATFTNPLSKNDDQRQSRAMKQLQALLKAILLRRMKTSKIDGKPILQLPARVIEKVHPIFSEDEQEFYTALETRTRLQFNRYVEAGTVGRNYSNMLVLLLRLRQACCHPHLIKDFAEVGISVSSSSNELDLIANAKRLDATVVNRLKTNEVPECPICIDAVENPVIFFPCGHSTCTECFTRIADPSHAITLGHDGTPQIKCPNCRASIDPKLVTDAASFNKVHGKGEEGPPEIEAPPDKEDNNESESDSDSDSDDDDDDDNGSLDGFIVNDDAGAKSSSRKKRRRDPKGKDRASKRPKVTLAELKKQSGKSAKAKRKYLKMLEKKWVTSAKVDKAMEILEEVKKNDPTEKTIVFSQFTSLLDLLEVPISRAGWSYRRYDGSMRPVERNASVVDFSDKPDCKILLVSLKAGNSGLNLVAASQVVILDPFWNPYIEEQAIDRAHRIGQMRPVVVHRMHIENTVEDRIIALQEKKRALIEGALDEKASRQVGRLGVQELAFLFDVRR